MVNISVQPVDMKPKDSLVPLNPLYCRCIQLTQSSFQAFREQILPDQLIIHTMHAHRWSAIILKNFYMS